ncbi:pumilio homolog 6, chloroplastic [Argentina anserina]|uniref:pumilio homolog 6, chloroplastic n=1 Tax=Argentina anserina TaxID=57926 RepID=UPI0021763198|nr:pumilio homolog 6, chloroplastic-like [Potentilla anserina]XP_050372306.1 pumilio homolog 6, chloroplastic-like [Potentilla anserina]
MATESPIRMSETGGNWASHNKPAKFAPSSANMTAEELELLLRDHRFLSSRKDVSPNRSGSAPPSMEGSFLAIDNLLSQQVSSITGSLASLSSVIERCESEEQLRSDPAYLAYYCANVNLNPRLPAPLISWENRRLARHIGSFSPNLGVVDDSGNGLFHMSPAPLPTHQEESEDDQSPPQALNDWVDKTNSGDEAAQLTGQQKNEGSCGSTSPVDNHSPTLSNGFPGDFNRGAVPNSLHHLPVNKMSPSRCTVDEERAADTVLPLNTESSSSPVATSMSHVHTRSTGANDVGVTPVESGMKSLSKSNMPENQKNQVQWPHSYPNTSLQYQIQQQQINLCQVQNATSHITPQGVHYTYAGMDRYLPHISKFAADAQPVLQTSGFAHPLYANFAAYTSGTHPYYSNFQAQSFVSPQYVSGYALSTPGYSPYGGGYHPAGTVPVVVEGTVGSCFNARTSVGSISPGADLQHMSKSYGQLGFPTQTSFTDPMYMQYYQQPFVESYGVPGQYASLASRGGPDLNKTSNHGASLDNLKIQHQTNGGPGNLNSQRGQVSVSYYGNAPSAGVLMQHHNSPLNSPALSASSIGSGRNPGLYHGHLGSGSLHDTKIYNFLEELKSGKGRRFELSDITGHIVEFSADQHGSRFIQQKLENCSIEEKASVFREVLPHACQLMTDVFGNYVIQKFFEYGSPQQRKDLANQLSGQILPLSMQMYGCRVIQKALDVIELEQKARLVRELDGHVMRCVRDQNGNHVIQKCIERIPTEKIPFIISAFHGQVATLSMHPYGCRVVQRVLEHCTNELQCQFIVDEILESVRALAQDQYGNYVSQHVLERGKPHERSRMISKLSGHIVQLSQHKFASNVVEKCLEYGDAAERELLIREIVGPNDGNDNLLVMMKDQFANYVVQKTLEICTNSQRTILINRIRAHTHALKKYTYGKHIVARFEQLFGEENQSGS